MTILIFVPLFWFNMQVEPKEDPIQNLNGCMEYIEYTDTQLEYDWKRVEEELFILESSKIIY